MVQFGFYALSVIVLLMQIFIIKNAIARRKSIVGYLVICAIWIAYLLLLSASGALYNFDLPPRVPLLIVIPAVAGIIFITGRKSFRNILQQSPLHIPVFMQSFRIIVELLIYSAFLDGVFPERATFKGLNFDILVGSSSLIIGFLVQRGILSSKGLLIWNVVSLLILTVTVYAFISTYYFTDYVPAGRGNKSFVEFPYLLLASVLLPAAIFLHVFSIRQAFAKMRVIAQITNPAV
jgi:hypothetical protein